jgi:multiple sugar transport system ATP-binding protein
VPPQRRDVAFVFQNYALYPHMTVAANMAFGLRMRKVSRSEIQQRVLETGRILGLEPLLGRYPAQLSGGERQRVALGRAIVRDPAGPSSTSRSRTSTRSSAARCAWS